MTHLYLLNTEQSNSHPNLCNLLSQSELYLMSSFKSKKRQKEFLWSRSLLNSVLKNKYGLSEHPIILKNANGKPYIKGHKVHFNISHSHNFVALVTNETEPVGIDVESFLFPKKTYMKVAQKYFSEAENKWLNTTRGDEQYYNFIRLWSLKEAVYKLYGLSLNSESTQIYFDLNKGKINQIPSYIKAKSLYAAQFEHISSCISVASEESLLNLTIESVTLKAHNSQLGFSYLPLNASLEIDYLSR